MLRTAGGVVYFQYPVIEFFALFPYFRGDGEIAPNFAKNLMVPSLGELL